MVTTNNNKKNNNNEATSVPNKLKAIVKKQQL